MAMRPEAVVFDMDGVIFDSERLVVECWKEVAEKYGMEDVETACRACLGITRPEAKAVFRRKYGPDFDYDLRKQEMSDLFFARYGEGRLPMKPGIVEILTSLKEAGIPVALASSTRREVVTRELADAGIIHFFTQIICGDMVTRSKPDPEIFLTACQALGSDPARTAGIEDSFNGIRAAAAGGLRTIMVPDMLQPTEEIRSLTEAVLPSLHEVCAYLLEA